MRAISMFRGAGAVAAPRSPVGEDLQAPHEPGSPGAGGVTGAARPNPRQKQRLSPVASLAIPPRATSLRAPMQVQIERVSPVVLELAVEVPAADVKAQVERVYADLQRKARVRGFRPGKAPRQVLAHLYGPQVASDVVNAIVQDTLPRALSEKNVTPVNQPHVEPGKFDDRAAFSYKARFEVQPEIGEVSYEGLDLVRPPEAPTEEGVNEQLEFLRKQHARLEAPEPARGSKKGDVLTIDFTLAVGGKTIKDAGGENVQLELGSAGVLPELDAALTGLNVDAELDVDAKFPGEHPHPDLKGQSGRFHVKLKDLKQRVLPALDDEFAKDVGSFQTLVELRADIHTRLTRALEERAEAALAEQVIDALNARNPVDVPPSLVEQQCRMMEVELAQNARRAGQRVSRDEFAKVHDRIHADAEKKVRAGLLMAAIAKKLEIKISDDDVQKGIEEIAAQTGKNVAKVKAEYSDAQRRQILIGMIIEDRVLDAIEAKANITTGTVEASAEKDGATKDEGQAGEGTGEAAGASNKKASKKKEPAGG
jgi:trigger factor